MEVMCHNLKGRKSKSLDKGCSVERERAKREKGKESKEKKEKGKKGQKGKREVIFLVFGLVYEGEQKRERGVRSSTFSLRFTEIGPSIFVGARGKVYLRDESFA